MQDCLDSLEEQTCLDFEVLVVCDHSSEEARQMLSGRNVSFPMRILELRGRRGVAAARNTGVQQAQGEYILFLDCDDYLEKTAIHDMLELAGEGTDILHAGLRETWYGRDVYYDNGEELDAQVSGEDNKPRGIEDLTVLGYMFRRLFLLQQKYVFDESFCYYADLPYITAVLSGTGKVAETEKVLYLKRRHNDPVRMPSLRQIPDGKRKRLEVMTAYQRMKKSLSGAAAAEVDGMFIHYFADVIAPWYLTAERSEVAEIYSEAVHCLAMISDEALAGAEPGTKRLIRYAGKHDPFRLVKKLRRQKRYRTWGRVLTSRAACKKYLYHKIFMRMKLKESTILFESFLGRSYSDSPRYIFEYLGKNEPHRYQCVWVLDHKEELPYPAKCIRRYSFRYFYYMARAKFFVFNSRQSRDFVKREGSIFLETWHGTPLKKLAFDMKEVTASAPLVKRDLYNHSREWDYLIAPNEFSARTFRRCFMYEGTILETGYPRNDILYQEGEEHRILMDRIRKRIGIPEGKKVILYAPTWRDDEFYAPARHKFTMQMDLGKMQKELGDQYVLFLRTHYYVVDHINLPESQDFVYDVSDYDDIAELYLTADLLITDYSSVFFDYANLKRPILFFMYDLEKYRDRLRGFYLDLEKDLPGPVLSTTDEVIHSVRNLEKLWQEYQKRYEAFYEKYCGWEDGKASQRVVDAVFGKEQESRV